MPRRLPQQVPELGTGTGPLDREENEATAGLSKLNGVFKSFNGGVKVINFAWMCSPTGVAAHSCGSTTGCCDRHFALL